MGDLFIIQKLFCTSPVFCGVSYGLWRSDLFQSSALLKSVTLFFLSLAFAL
jgi:hypothetical protein